MKFKTLILFYLIGHGITSFAQDRKPLYSGTVVYEKTINLYGATQQQDGALEKDAAFKKLENFKKNHPQFLKLTSKLYFDTTRTFFKPDDPTIENSTTGNYVAVANQFNQVYFNFKSDSSIIQREIFGSTFLIKDIIPKIKWKITNETREIAGYTCKRANGVLLDSVQVVAFFTNKIPVSGGPERFSGLPGLILGVALPHEHISWYATKINNETITPEPPRKGSVLNNQEIEMKMRSITGKLGLKGQYLLKVLLIQ